MLLCSFKDHQISENDKSHDEQDPGDVDDKPTGWATALKKVLKSKKACPGESVVLSKAKKVKEIEQIKKQKKGYGFEIEGEVKDEKPDPEELIRQLKKPYKGERRLVREHLLSLRVKPSMVDRERERTFQKTATKGMVQLFNAVRAQQTHLDEKLQEAGKPEYKREKVLKSVSKKSFLDALMNGPRAKSELIDNPVKVEPNRKKFKRELKDEPDSDDSAAHRQMWSALKDDFMANSGWKKDDDGENDEIKSEEEPDTD